MYFKQKKLPLIGKKNLTRVFLYLLNTLFGVYMFVFNQL